MIAFIVWAWRDSSKVQTIASAYGWTLRQAGSILSIYRTEAVSNNDPWSGRFQVDPATAPWDGAFLAEPMLIRSTDAPEAIARFFAVSGPGSYVPRRAEAVHLNQIFFSPARGWALLIPHWLLLLAVALPWAALLLWRARRRRLAAMLKE